MIVSAGAPGGLTTLEMGELVLKTPKERDAILEALKQNIIFSALDNSILYQVADRVQTLHFPAGHTIIRRGARRKCGCAHNRTWTVWRRRTHCSRRSRSVEVS